MPHLALRIARSRARLTQQQLARRARVNHATVAKLEAGTHSYLRARYDTVINLARVLHRRPDRLFPVPALGPLPPEA